MEILKIKDINKTYGKGEAKVEAIKNMNFSVKKGEFIAIIGASGSGKSTLLNIIGGIDTPTSGQVYIDGEDIYTLNDERLSTFRRRKIGFVFQSYNLIPVLTVEENVKMPVLLDNKKADQKYIDELLETLGIANKKKNLPNELSGGQQQRVSIARALSNSPSIVLADEPTGNLDKKNGQKVINLLIAATKKYSQTLIVITHDMEIANLASRIIKIEDGEMISDEVIRHE